VPNLIDDSLRQRLLASIAGDSLVVLCGAGLSMAPPSKMPSAWHVAQHCALKYREITGMDMPVGFADDIEKMAKHFYDRSELKHVFLRQLIDWSGFVNGQPNKGHTAIADFLATRLVAVALSTNVDMLFESAALSLGEPDFFPLVASEDINRVQNSHAPLVKIHGCATKTRWDTLWCKQQMNDEPLKTRIHQLAGWVRGHFPNRDLLVVGFWTDWGYLNDILSDAVVSTEPRSVVVIDPSTKTALKDKSPSLWNWASKSADFTHVRASGDEFLDELRHIVSCHYITSVWEKGKAAYRNVTEHEPPVVSDALLTPASTDSLYQVRRDLAGVNSSSVVRQNKAGDGHTIIGLLHLALMACGAKMNSNTFQLNGSTIRLINAPGSPLSKVTSHFSAEPPDPIGITRNVAVGAFEDGGVPGNIIQRGVPGGIIRNAPTAQWESHEALLGELKGALR
jgi:hypothetical protein